MNGKSGIFGQECCRFYRCLTHLVFFLYDSFVPARGWSLLHPVTIILKPFNLREKGNFDMMFLTPCFCFNQIISTNLTP